LKVLPGVTFSNSVATDSNAFLFHSHWISWGTKVAGNLIGVIRLPRELDAIEAQQALHRQNALDIAATIVMQVHVARARLAVQTRSYRDAKQFADAQRQLLQQVRTAVAVGRSGKQGIVREKLATLLAETRATLAFADVEAARAAYATARGDPIELPGTSVAMHLSENISDDSRGH
jgi:hypothetical protein